MTEITTKGLGIRSRTGFKDIDAMYRIAMKREEDPWFRNGLEDLKTDKSNVTDISPLAHLEGLQYVSLGHMAVSSIDPLRSCKQRRERPRLGDDSILKENIPIDSARQRFFSSLGHERTRVALQLHSIR
jgi:hypothetical protein